MQALRVAPTVAVETITPELAQKWLERVVPNRKISEPLLLDYAIAIDEGKWILNGETIKFNGNDALLDGQHRLKACMLAKKPFQSCVVRGISDEAAFSTIDQGKGRSLGDIFTIDGWPSSNIAGSAAVLLILYQEKRISWRGPLFHVPKGFSMKPAVGHVVRARQMVSKDLALAYAQQHRERLQAAVRFSCSHKAAPLVYSSVLAALYFLFREKHAALAESFFDDLGEGAGLARDNPIWVLRERLITLSRDRPRAFRWQSMGLNIKTWNKVRAGEKLKSLIVGPDEEFPIIK